MSEIPSSWGMEDPGPAVAAASRGGERPPGPSRMGEIAGDSDDIVSFAPSVIPGAPWAGQRLGIELDDALVALGEAPSYESVSDEARGGGTSAVRGGREMARYKIFLSRTGVDPSKLTTKQLVEGLEKERIKAATQKSKVFKKPFSVRKSLKGHEDIREKKKDDREDKRESKASRKEMNKAYKARLSVSLGKLAYHLILGRVVKKGKEVFQTLDPTAQAVVGGIGGLAVTLTSAEALRWMGGEVGDVIDKSLPRIGRPWEFAAAVAAGVAGAAYGPVKGAIDRGELGDMISSGFSKGVSMGRGAVSSIDRRVRRKPRTDEDRIETSREGGRGRS